MKPSKGIEFKIRHLIVPLDGSRLAEAALPITRQLAQKLGAPVTLVHLIERHAPQHIHGEHHLSNPEEAERYLTELGRRFFPADPRVAQHVHASEITDVPRAIAEHATELGSDLVVMCAHGQIGLRTVVVWEYCAKSCGFQRCPGLADQAGRSRRSTCSHATVQSWSCWTVPSVDEQSLPLAAALAKVCGGSLHLVVVVPTLRTLVGCGRCFGVCCCRRRPPDTPTGSCGCRRLPLPANRSPASRRFAGGRRSPARRAE